MHYRYFSLWGKIVLVQSTTEGINVCQLHDPGDKGGFLHSISSSPKPLTTSCFAAAPAWTSFSLRGALRCETVAGSSVHCFTELTFANIEVASDSGHFKMIVLVVQWNSNPSR